MLIHELDTIEAPADPTDAPVCEAPTHAHDGHPATHYISMSCGHDSFICADRAERAISQQTRGLLGDIEVVCPFASHPTTIERLVAL